jgi:hypothetical protein
MVRAVRKENNTTTAKISMTKHVWKKTRNKRRFPF